MYQYGLEVALGADYCLAGDGVQCVRGMACMKVYEFFMIEFHSVV